MAELNKPKLYTYNGELYSFNDLSRSLDSGFADYISTLRRGDKDSEEFWNAYSNLMSGIGDGTITFENGRFKDSLGRYSNGVWYDSEGKKLTSEKRSRDYYGLVANYIARGLRKQKKYLAEEPKPDNSKIKWGNAAGTEALAKLYFNTSTPNISYFLDLDPVLDGQRGTTNRVAAIRSFINDHFLNNSYDNTFSGYTDADKALFIKYAQLAYDALADNSIDVGDKLALSRIFPNVNLDEMFYTGEKLELQQHPEQLEPELTPQGFLTYLDTDWVRKPNDYGSLLIFNSDINYGNWTANRIILAIQSADDKTLLDYLGTAINDSNREFGYDPLFKGAVGNEVPHIPSLMVARLIMTRLDKEGRLVLDQNNPNIYYIPGMIDKNTNSGYYYDKSTKTIYKKSVRDIPYWLERIYNEWSGNTLEPGFKHFFTSVESKKKGGILKALTGVKFSDNANWYTGVFTPLLDYILLKLELDKNYYTWLNDMQDRHSEIYNLAGSDWQNTAFRNDLVGTYLDQYKKGYNNEWRDNTAGYNSLGILNAQTLGMFDVSGRKRTSGDWNGNGNNWNTDSLYSAITDFRRLLGRKGDYTPELLAEVTLKFKDKGYSFVEGANGYYKLVPIELVVDEKGEKGTGGSKESHTFPRGEEKSSNFKYNNALLNLGPEFLEIGRLAASLRTNNRVWDILRNSIKPVLYDTYERYSPITGAFSEMQFRNRLAADLQRLVSRPFTSDASLQLAGLLDASKQARDLLYLGFMADDKEIRRTRAEALMRLEDNMARRSKVTNLNRESLNRANREIAELDATRQKENWRSWDNYAQGVLSRWRLNLVKKEGLMQDSSLQLASDMYLGAVSTLNRQYKEQNPNATTSSMLNDLNYIDQISDLRNRYKYDLYNIRQGRYFSNPYQNNIPKTYDEILSAKKGGTLRPNVMYLINKVIRNENNS